MLALGVEAAIDELYPNMINEEDNGVVIVKNAWMVYVVVVLG